MLTKREFKGVINLILNESIKIWSTIDVNYFGEWAQGCGFPQKYQGSKDGEILFCKVSDMNLEGNNIFITKTVNTITSDLARKINVKIHSQGTVIFPKIGGAIATNKRRILLKKTAIDNNCTGIIPNNNTNSKWLYYMLRYFDFSQFQTGTSVPALNQANLEKNIHLPRVPLLEQELIANFLDYYEESPEELNDPPKLPKLLEPIKVQIEKKIVYIRNLEALSKEYKNQLELIDLLHQKILQEAISGKLIPQNPNDELASELLKKIRAEKDRLILDQGLKKEKSLPLILDEEIPYDIPKGWSWVRLGELCSHISDIDHNMPKTVEKGVKFLSAKDLLNNGEINLTNDIKLISEADYLRLSRKITPQRGDIIYSRIGARLGKARIVETDEKFLVSYSCCIIRPILMNINYLSRYLDSGIVLSQALKNTQSIGVPDLGIQKIKEFLIAVPSLREQECIVEKVTQLMKICNQLEEKNKEGKENSELLMEVILKEAFEY